MAGDHSDEGDKWWQFILYGLALFGFAAWMYGYLTGREQEGGRFRIQWIMALVYDFPGKWGVTGILAGLGLISLLIGAWQFGKSRTHV
jgi:hypothetical protein